MAQNQKFTCQACGAHFGSRRELEEHNKKSHPDMAQKHTGEDGGTKR
jgi:hypothetical protein